MTMLKRFLAFLTRDLIGDLERLWAWLKEKKHLRDRCGL